MWIVGVLLQKFIVVYSTLNEVIFKMPNFVTFKTPLGWKTFIVLLHVSCKGIDVLSFVAELHWLQKYVSIILKYLCNFKMGLKIIQILNNKAN